MPEKKNVTIVGAGLVGSLLSIMMAKRGHRVALYEKRPDMRKEVVDGGRSINLVVTSRGIHALKQTGLWQEFQQITTPVFGRMMHSLEGELTFQRYGKDNSECNYSVSRAQLNKKLMDEAEKNGVKIHFLHTLVSADFDLNELIFIDEVSKKNIISKSDLIFGADGAGSATRKELMKFFERKGIEHSDNLGPLGSQYKELFMPSDKQGQYAIEKNALHIWPRGFHMLMALPNLDGSFTMTLYLPEKGSVSFEALKSKDDVKHFFEKEYKDSTKLMPNYLNDFFENPTGHLGTVRCYPWIYSDKVALVGDAAHAIVPFFGQGMNCGFEDCTYLMKFLDESNGNYTEAFQRYNEFQRPNGNAIADMAIENFIEMKDKVGDENFLFKKKIEQVLTERFPEKYKSRYAMVTYTLIPYSLAQRAGEIQSKILDELAMGISDIEELDLQKANDLLDKKFVPFLNENSISLERYR